MVDGGFLTGQNPASASALGTAILKALDSRLAAGEIRSQ